MVTSGFLWASTNMVGLVAVVALVRVVALVQVVVALLSVVALLAVDPLFVVASFSVVPVVRMWLWAIFLRKWERPKH